jgi:hypothetical protein
VQNNPNVSTALLFAAMAFAAYGQDQPPAAEPEIVTDRPDITESGIVVPKDSLQFENGATWTSDHGETTLDLSETLVRFGISDRTELRFVAPNYFDGLTGANSASGFDDIALGMKQQLGPLPGDVDLAVIVAFSLPTGAPRISSHGYDPFIKFPWSKDLKDGWSIGGMHPCSGIPRTDEGISRGKRLSILKNRLRNHGMRLRSTEATSLSGAARRKWHTSGQRTRSRPRIKSISISDSACRK